MRLPTAPRWRRWPGGCCSIRARSGRFALLGVGFSGLSNVRQESLFPDLELTSLGYRSGDGHRAGGAGRPWRGGRETSPGWRVGDDVTHRDLGHGWVQGAGHGVVTVRFETRGSGPGPARTLPSDTDDITPANPVDSLDWPDYVAAACPKPRQRRRSTTSCSGSRAANAAITSTRA